jgi:hypothetical protein
MEPKIIKFTAILLFLAGTFACKENENNSDVTTELKGTKWKLAGIVNGQTGAMQVLEPTDSSNVIRWSLIRTQQEQVRVQQIKCGLILIVHRLLVS